MAQIVVIAVLSVVFGVLVAWAFTVERRMRRMDGRLDEGRDCCWNHDRELDHLQVKLTELEIKLTEKERERMQTPEETPDEAEAQRRYREEQEAFRQMQNYNADVAYGIGQTAESER